MAIGGTHRGKVVLRKLAIRAHGAHASRYLSLGWPLAHRAHARCSVGLFIAHRWAEWFHSAFSNASHGKRSDEKAGHTVVDIAACAGHTVVDIAACAVCAKRCRGSKTSSSSIRCSSPLLCLAFLLLSRGLIAFVFLAALLALLGYQPCSAHGSTAQHRMSIKH